MKYQKTLARKYAKNRNFYKSADGKLQIIVEKVGINGKDILDFGCGDGSESIKFIDAGAKGVIGIDPSAEMIRLANRRKIARAKFIRSDGTKIPLKGLQFDLVYSRYVFHYVKDLNKTFKEIQRVLRKNGHLVAIFQCLTDKDWLLNRRVPMILGKGRRAIKLEIYSKSPDEVRLALKSSDLRMIDFIEVTNRDARIDPGFKFKSNFKKRTYILHAKKAVLDV